MNANPDVKSPTYDGLFYQYQREGAARSAYALLPTVIGSLGVRSVLDIGCGTGAWLSAYRALGVSDCLGVDGDYVDRSMLMIDQAMFISTDITRTFDCHRRFDLVQCLEVGEHVPREASEILIDNIIRHGRLVLFSAAVPGQGGKRHINEQPFEFWRDKFALHGFRLFDFVRPSVAGNVAIEPWYRHNILLFVHDSTISSLSPAIIATRIPESAAIRDYSPVGYRLRRSILRLLPESAVSMLAVCKHKRIVRSLQRRKTSA